MSLGLPLLRFAPVTPLMDQISNFGGRQRNSIASWDAGSSETINTFLRSAGGEWVDGGEFPPSLGSFATLLKATRGQPLESPNYPYLNAVHMNIAFGNCLSIGVSAMP